jgi:SAM-dependent methyltransferase
VDVRAYFEERFRRHGPTRDALDWSERGQRVRFAVIADAADLRGKRVLDLGCGLGDLYPFLRDRFGDLDYTGWDFFEPFVAHARGAHPRARFEVHDVLHDPIPGRYDVVVSSGVHNVESGANDAEMIGFLGKAWDAAGEAVAVTMLSARADQREDRLHYYDPGRMLAAAQALTRYAVLRHDYLPHDLALYLYREPRAVSGTPPPDR